MEILPLLQSIMIGCAFSNALSPAVEYRVCPIEALPGNLFNTSGLKISSTSPIARCAYRSFPSRRNNSRRFLPAMLQRIQAQIHQLGGFFVPVHPHHATMVVEVIVSECELCHHFVSDVISSSVRSSELAQTSRKSSTGESTTARPLYSMRSEPFRVTWPISLAATPYCRAIA